MRDKAFRFIRCCLASGIPFGVLGGLLFGMTYGATWPQMLAFGGVTGAGFGLSQGTVTRLFPETPAPSCGTYFSRGATMGALGLVGGVLAFIAAAYFPAGAWRQLPSPPERPVEIVTNWPFNIWGGTIFVRTASEDIYAFDCHAERPCGWTRLDSVPLPAAELGPPCPPASGEGPPPPGPPGRATQLYQVRVCGADYSIYVAYVLLADGSIWTADRFSSVYEWFGVLPLFAALGAVVAVIVIVNSLASSPAPESANGAGEGLP